MKEVLLKLKNKLKIIVGNKIIVIIIIILTIILFPLFIDNFIIANHIPSNLSNSEWFSFLSSYLGGVLGGAATLIAIWITYNQTRSQYEKQEEENKVYQRLAIIPFLQIDMEGVGCKRDNEDHFVIDNHNKVSCAVVFTDDKVLHVDDQIVYPYRSSNSENIIEFVLEYIEEDYIINGEASILLKEVCITNIGLQAAIVANCYINNQCVWKFNLAKDQQYRFWIAIAPEMIERRIDITIAFRDLYNNEYVQEAFFEAKIQEISSVIPPHKMRVESFWQSMTTSPKLTKSK